MWNNVTATFEMDESQVILQVSRLWARAVWRLAVGPIVGSDQWVTIREDCQGQYRSQYPKKWHSND